MNPTENIFDSYWLEYFSNTMYQHIFFAGEVEKMLEKENVTLGQVEGNTAYCV